MVSKDEFFQSVDFLEVSLKEAISNHFRLRGIEVDLDLMPQSAMCFRQIALDAHIQGAEIFPSGM